MFAARSRSGASRFVPTEWSVAVKAARASFCCWSSVVFAGSAVGFGFGFGFGCEVGSMVVYLGFLQVVLLTMISRYDIDM